MTIPPTSGISRFFSGKRKLSSLAILIFSFTQLPAQEKLIVNPEGRRSVSLNGTWHYIVDPYENGFFNYRYQERNEDDREAYWNRPILNDKSDRIEHAYEGPYTLQVPGDWNAQEEKFLYYEGTVWYQRNFDLEDINKDERVFLYFGAVNYEAHVYLNGKKLGSHKGGFTPFNFEIPADLLQEQDNFLVVKVDNKRHPDEIPTVNTDWWNFGGITRDVELIIVPRHFLRQYALQLDPEQDIKAARENGTFRLTGNLQLSDEASGGPVTVEIPELKVRQEFESGRDSPDFHMQVQNLELWSPENPKLYEVTFSYNGEEIRDKIGFRKIETSGEDVLLNGKEIFLRGISIHEEIPQEMRRAHSKQDALQLLGWARELNANMVRLAHYPHNANMTRVADSLGLLVWSEIPVYWTIDFENPEVMEKARKQLQEMIVRDRNRASVIIWSVGNETPVHPARTTFMKNLVSTARKLDNSRLISAALEVNYQDGINKVDDPLGAVTDLIAVNEYLGWYGGMPDDSRTVQWEIAYDKPFFFSETGAGALPGYHADKETRWSEEYQEWYFEEKVKMYQRLPSNFTGLSPWILVDFRSPRRQHPIYQRGWNRKGLIGNNGERKKAFDVLRKYYESKD